MKKRSKRVRINIRLPEELIMWVRRYAKLKGMTMTAVIEQVLREYLDAQPAPVPRNRK